MSAAPVKLRIDPAVLQQVDLSRYAKYVAWSPGAAYFNLPAGKEHYHLLNLLAAQLPPDSIVADCGTLYGCSAIALAVSNTFVFTYDTVDHITSRVHSVGQSELDTIWGFPNIQPILAPCHDHMAPISECSLVILDIDPHDGEQELRFVNALTAHRFRGILICDDIHLNTEMENFWQSRPPGLPRYDLTPYGHWSGTGAVVFDPNVIDLEIIT